MGLKKYRRKAGGNYYLRGTVAGVYLHESTGTSRAADAEAIRIRRESEILNRHAHGKSATLTFAEAASTYLETGGEARFLARLIRYFGPDVLVRDLDNAKAQAAATELYPGAAPATVNRQCIGPISAVVNMALEGAGDPPRRFKRRKEPQGRLRWLTPEEAEALIENAAPHILPALGFMLGAGPRCSEALAIDVSRFYPATAEAWVAKSKNGDARMLRMPGRARGLVLSQGLPDVGTVCRTPKGNPYVQRENGGGQIQNAFNRARDAAGLGPEVTPHVLRHTWATWFYAATKDFGGLLDIGGWRKPEMAMRYRKIAPDDLPERLLKHGWDFTRLGLAAVIEPEAPESEAAEPQAKEAAGGRPFLRVVK